jgi:lipopolysaccharide export system protein LptA
MSLLTRPTLRLWLLTLPLWAVAWPSAAERADRLQPIVVEADKPGTLDLQRQVVTFNGNVQIVQGTMVIKAEHIEVRELADGHRVAVATGLPGRPASYRQKRDGVNEYVEGSADRIEYDSRAGTLRFVGNGAVRRLRDGVVADQITGALISWDDQAELFSVQGGSPAEGGRVRAVLTPPGAASAPAAEAPR